MVRYSATSDGRADGSGLGLVTWVEEIGLRGVVHDDGASEVPLKQRQVFHVVACGKATSSRGENAEP